MALRRQGGRSGVPIWRILAACFYAERLEEFAYSQVYGSYSFRFVHVRGA